MINYLNETGRGRETGDFHDLWGEFQRRARGLVAAASTQVVAGVVRSSTLTEEGRRQRYLDPEYYVIQVCVSHYFILIFVFFPIPSSFPHYLFFREVGVNSSLRHRQIILVSLPAIPAA